jgi:hypothetical protein
MEVVVIVVFVLSAIALGIYWGKQSVSKIT